MGFTLASKRGIIKSVQRTLTAIVIVCALLVGQSGPRVFASSPIVTTGATDSATDREALVAFYQATNGDNWKNSGNWLTDAPIGTWYGVTTDYGGRVVELAIIENGLTGMIPPELGNLTNLEWLDLRENELSGTIPPELDNLTDLEWLSLSDNELSGTIPPELGNLTKLEGLFLSANQLRGCVPEVWRNVEGNDLDLLGLPLCLVASSTPTVMADTKDRDALVALYLATDGANWQESNNWLTGAPLGDWYGVNTDDSGRVIELDLSFNGLSGTIPSEMANLTNLESLVLRSNQLSGTIPPELFKLTNLVRLDLSYNRLSGTIPSEMGKITYLERLLLHANELSGAIPSELGNLTNLTGLSLCCNKLTGTIPSELSNLINLIFLSLNDNRLGGAIPSELGNLTNLTSLSLCCNKLTGAIPLELGNLTYLTELGLSENELSGSIPSELGNLTDLAGLGLWDNRLSGTIPPELGNLTNLLELGLSENELSGCVPAAWRTVVESDLDKVGLPFCAASSPTATRAAERLTRPQIFARVSPAIAFIQTENATGSGVLIEGGYLVTNAHVVWPFDTARVVFPGGTEFDQVAVKGWDLLADVAVLGPIDAPAQPVALLDGENIPIASDMYLIGYPGEFEAFPQPTIAGGVLSRLREWEPAGITFFQSDASIAGGQSGGALVSGSGDVIGISGYKIIEGQFALVASSADILPRIRQLIAGEDPSGLGKRQLPLEGGKLRHELTLQSHGDAYILNEPAGTAIEVELSGADKAGFWIYDSFGDELTDDETDSFSFDTERDGPHFLVLSEAVSDKLMLTSSHPLTRFDDPDDYRQIRVGQPRHGNIDFPTDIDSLFLHLAKDETVEIVARSALVDTALAIWDPTAEAWAEDDDSGGGLLGQDARIVFQAPTTGEYVLLVHDAGWSAPGGYVISVKRVEETDRTTSLVSTETPARSVPVLWIHNPLVIPTGDTPAVSGGPFQDWPAVEDEAHGLKIFYPKGWLFASSKEELPSLLPQMGDSAIAEVVLEGRAAYIDSLAPAGQEDQFAGLGFQFDPDSPPVYINGFDLFTIPAAGRTLAEYAQLLADQMEESEVETLESVEVGPGLRPWGEEAASIRYRSVWPAPTPCLRALGDRPNNGVFVVEDRVVTRPGAVAVGWQVVLLSPDSETFLLITFDVWGGEFDGLELLLREIVRRVQWLEHPAYDPPTGPMVTINRTMNVRGGPGINHPIIGTATAGHQYAALGKNAAGDWWQIEYGGELAWVYGGFLAPFADAVNVPLADPSGWLVYDDDARGLSLSYPSGWRYFDPAQPSQADLALFSAAAKGRDGGQLDVAEMGAMVSAMSVRRDDAVIGLGLQSDQANDAASNFMLVFSFAADGMTLDRYSQMAAEYLQGRLGVEDDSVELALDLRPLGEEAVSIRYREYETNSEVWQVWLLSPDEGTLLVLAFSVHSDEFAALQPLLSEIVQQVRWAD